MINTPRVRSRSRIAGKNPAGIFLQPHFSNLCAKAGIRSNLNLITDKGNIYSFTLEDVSNQNADPDLKVIVQPSDESSIAAPTGPAPYVPVSEVTTAQNQLRELQSQIVQTIDQYKDKYRGQLKFDYRFKQNEAPFNIASIFHDDRFTYIKSDAQEKFTLYEVRDGAPNHAGWVQR